MAIRNKLMIDGRPSKRVPRLGGVRACADGEVPDWNRLSGLSFYESYQDSCFPAAYSSHERLRWMDQTEVSATLLFPSLGLLWPQEAPAEPDYIRAHMRAYNRWLLEFCAPAPGRLYGVAQMCLFDVATAVDDLHELRRLGFRHVMLPWMPPGSPSCFHGDYERFWSAAQDLGMTFHLHKVAIPHQLNLAPGARMGGAGNGRFFDHVNQTLPGALCLTSIMDNRIPDKVPRLPFAFHECNAGWVAAWLDRADESYLTCSDSDIELTQHPPSHYVLERDTFFFGMSLGEKPENIASIQRRTTLASDFPHPGCSKSPGHDWSERLKELPPQQRDALLWGNAQRLLSN